MIFQASLMDQDLTLMEQLMTLNETIEDIKVKRLYGSSRESFHSSCDLNIGSDWSLPGSKTYFRDSKIYSGKATVDMTSTENMTHWDKTQRQVGPEYNAFWNYTSCDSKWCCVVQSDENKPSDIQHRMALLCIYLYLVICMVDVYIVSIYYHHFFKLSVVFLIQNTLNRSKSKLPVVELVCIHSLFSWLGSEQNCIPIRYKIEKEPSRYGLFFVMEG